jgi:hypothetical protein
MGIRRNVDQKSYHMDMCTYSLSPGMLYCHVSSSCLQLFSSKEGNWLPSGTKLDQEADQKHLYAKLFEYTDNYSGSPAVVNTHGNWVHSGDCNKETICKETHYTE